MLVNLNSSPLTGPATDNEVGRAYVQSHLELPAANARVDPERLAQLVEERLTIAASTLPGERRKKAR